MAPASSPESVNATYCATLVDEWVRCGLRHAVICPGSRSTPLTLALAARPELDTHVVLDERSGGFVALGLGLATGRPAVVVTTSGTAAAELHPAVVEAHHAAVPLLACTADRPPELHDVGAPQTIDQAALFGGVVRWSTQPGPPAVEARASWRSLAARAWLEATGRLPGPVHLDVAFREPLVGEAGDLPPGRPGGRPWHRRLATTTAVPAEVAAELAASWSARPGLVVAGAGVERPDDVLALARALGWPVLADPRSGCRRPEPEVVAHADAILRSTRAAAALRPQLVLQLGAPPASKVLAQWLSGCGAERVVVGPAGPRLDPDRDAALVVEGEPGAVCGAVLAALGPGGGRPGRGPRPSPAASWRALDDGAAAAIEAFLASAEASEAGLARAVVAAAGPRDVLVASSSMPVRDVEWYAAPRAGLRVLANRGANGIDGVTSTAVGVALAGPTTWLLIGDLALHHDASGLLGATGRAVRLRLVVVDNDGGGIFSFLPPRSALPAGTFERYFGTPQPLRPEALLGVHGIPASVATDGEGVRRGLAALAEHPGPVAALVVRTDRDANVAHHEALHRAVAAAVEQHLPGAGGSTGQD